MHALPRCADHVDSPRFPRLLFCLGTVFALLVAAPSARAAEGTAALNDFLLPGAGQIQLTASSGLPFAALGEISVGIGGRFAVGAFVAGGPFVGGLAAGINPRIDALHVGPMRLVLEAPIVWYPGMAGNDNWMVFRPMARVEGHAGRVRVHGSVGAMYATIVGASPVSGPIQPYGGQGLPSGVQDGKLWDTVGGGVAVAITPRTAVFAEGFVILNGLQVAGPEWFSLPGAAFLGVSTTL